MKVARRVGVEGVREGWSGGVLGVQAEGWCVGEGVEVTRRDIVVAARRDAREAAVSLRKARAEAERRRERLAADLLAALGERDAAVAAAEVKAGRAIRAMSEDGVSIADVATHWCRDRLTVTEANRLARAAAASDAASQ